MSLPVARNRSRLVVGGVDKVMTHLEPLIRNTQADELMITTMIYDHEARKRSYTLLAEAFSVAAPHARSHAQTAVI